MIYKSAFRHVPVLSCLVDLYSYTFVDVNDGLAEYLGFEDFESLVAKNGQSFSSVFESVDNNSKLSQCLFGENLILDTISITAIIGTFHLID